GQGNAGTRATSPRPAPAFPPSGPSRPRLGARTPGKECPMGRNLRRVVVACLSLALIVGLPASAWALSDGKRAARGAAYLASQQQPDGSIPAFSPIGSTSDAVLAFVASGVGGKAMNKAVGYLRAQTSA